MRRKPTRTEVVVARMIVIVLSSLLVDSTEVRRRQWPTCALCQLVRIDYESVFGNRWSEIEQTECSDWYPKNIQPRHKHVWQRSSSAAGFNIFGEVLWVSDSDRPTGINSITPKEQIAVYQHVPDVEELQLLFVSLREYAESGGRTKYPSLRGNSSTLGEWEDSSFANPWEEIKPEFMAP